MTLTSTGVNLLATTPLGDPTNPGANTEFDINGQHVIKPGSVVSDVVTGVSFTFNGTSTILAPTASITVASSGSQMSSALQDLVAKYNAVSAQVNAQRGSAAGLLIGNPMINQARQALFSLMNTSSSSVSGSVQGLASLGIELSNSGVMSFKSATFSALTASQITDAYSFLGNSTAGPAAMQSQFQQLSDPATGAIKMQQDAWDVTDKRLSAQVLALNTRIAAMQATLQSKLQVADSLLASLTSQQNVLTQSISSLNFTSGYTAKANA